MRDFIQWVAYAILLGPPRAMKLHAEAQGQGGELDGLPLWLVYGAEFMMRTAMFLLASWGVQEALSHEVFRRFQVPFLVGAVFVSGIVHTHVHFYCFAVKRGQWSRATLGRVYRLGRNLAYAVVPAFPVAGLVLVWQDYHRIPLFAGPWVETAFFSTWGLMAALGLGEALLVKRKPLGIVLGQPLGAQSKKSAP